METIESFELLETLETLESLETFESLVTNGERRAVWFERAEKAKRADRAVRAVRAERAEKGGEIKRHEGIGLYGDGGGLNRGEKRGRVVVL